MASAGAAAPTVATGCAFAVLPTSADFPKRAAISDGAALYAALREDGVVVVDISDPALDDADVDLSLGDGATVKQTLAALDCARRFFELPRTTKFELVGPTHRLGYAPALAENYAALAGDATEPNDPVEKLRLSRSPSSDGAWDALKEALGEEHGAEAVSVLRQYHESMSRLSTSLLAALSQHVPALECAPPATALRVDGKDDDGDGGNGGSTPLEIKPETEEDGAAAMTLTLNGYRRERVALPTVNEGETETIIIAAHVDISVLTIVVFDEGSDVATLQIKRRHSDEWMDVDCLRAPRGDAREPSSPFASVLVLAGDCLAACTRGAVSAPLHRVVARARNDVISDGCGGGGHHGNEKHACDGTAQCATDTRCSLAFFVDLPPKTLIPGLRVDDVPMPFAKWRRKRSQLVQKVVAEGARLRTSASGSVHQHKPRGASHKST